MTSIVVTAEQAQMIKAASDSVALVSPAGEWLGVLNNHGWTHEDIEAAKASLNSDEPRYTTAQVLEHLRSLESTSQGGT
jgi:hypothetical protein